MADCRGSGRPSTPTISGQQLLDTISLAVLRSGCGQSGRSWQGVMEVVWVAEKASVDGDSQWEELRSSRTGNSQDRK